MKITDYISYSYVRHQLPEYSFEDMVRVTVTIENEIINKTKPDHRTIDAIFIKTTKNPGVQIFVLEPTKNDLRNSKFTLDENTNLTIHYNGWIYSSTQIVFPKRPSHPIVYATLDGYELPQNQPTLSFDPVQQERRNKSAPNGWTPDFIPDRISNPIALNLMDERDYCIGEVITGNRNKQVHMKFIANNQIGILETNSYFLRYTFKLEAGCRFFDGSKLFNVTNVEYTKFPRFPILTLSKL